MPCTIPPAKSVIQKTNRNPILTNTPPPPVSARREQLERSDPLPNPQTPASSSTHTSTAVDRKSRNTRINPLRPEKPTSTSRRTTLSKRDLTKAILHTIEKKRPNTVAELISRLPSTNRREALDAIRHLEDEGRIELHPPPPTSRGTLQYLRSTEESLWAQLTLTIVAATLLTVYLLPAEYPIIAVRWILGSLFVLYLPGYSAVEALFPGRETLDGIERFALSLGLSLAIAPLVGLILNYTPWGIRLDPIMAALSLLTATLTLIAIYRKRA